MAKTIKGEGRIGDEAVAARTGKTWAQWFEILDAAGARKLDHKGIVALVGQHSGVDGWWQQMVTVTYEQNRGLRRKHEKPEGFEVSGSRTVEAPLGELYRAWSDAKTRRRWLPGAKLAIHKATANKSLRIAWGESDGRVDVNFYPKGASRSQVTVQHGRLPSAAEAERKKAFWKERLSRLKDLVERS